MVVSIITLASITAASGCRPRAALRVWRCSQNTGAGPARVASGLVAAMPGQGSQATSRRAVRRIRTRLSMSELLCADVRSPVHSPCATCWLNGFPRVSSLT